MSKPTRCACGHRPGPRVLSYRRAKGGAKANTPVRQHKKPCDCPCHADPRKRRPRTALAAALDASGPTDRSDP